MKTEYGQQAETFLTIHGLQFRATLKNTKPAPWADDTRYRPHYRVTISRPGKRLSFDFWNSVDAGRTGKPLTAYDVLACISSDAYTPDTFEEFCADYGYDTDSRKAHATFRRASAFAKRIRAFFTAEELKALSEIQ